MLDRDARDEPVTVSCLSLLPQGPLRDARPQGPSLVSAVSSVLTIAASRCREAQRAVALARTLSAVSLLQLLLLIRGLLLLLLFLELLLIFLLLL